MTGMVDVLAAAVEVNRLCERHGWKFCFIGGIAVQRWGNPRFTVDVDLTLLTGYGSEERFVDAVLEQLEPRRPDARQFAVLHRVLLARTKHGVDVDIALGAFATRRCAMARQGSAISSTGSSSSRANRASRRRRGFGTRGLSATERPGRGSAASSDTASSTPLSRPRPRTAPSPGATTAAF